MIRQVTSGLEHIHSKNIVHLDLKPENLIAKRNPNGDFNCKIVDFGIAEHVTDEAGFIRTRDFYNFTEIKNVRRNYGGDSSIGSL